MGGKGLGDLSRGTTAVAVVAEVAPSQGFDLAVAVWAHRLQETWLQRGSGVSANRTIQCFGTVTAVPHQPTSVV